MCTGGKHTHTHTVNKGYWRLVTMGRCQAAWIISIWQGKQISTLTDPGPAVQSWCLMLVRQRYVVWLTVEQWRGTECECSFGMTLLLIIDLLLSSNVTVPVCSSVKFNYRMWNINNCFHKSIWMKHIYGKPVRWIC